MKTTMDLPDDLIRAVKLRAVMQGRTVKDLVAEFLREGLAPRKDSKERDTSPLVDMESGGLPMIRCAPDAPATRMSTDELVRLEQESQGREDLQRAGLSL